MNGPGANATENSRTSPSRALSAVRVGFPYYSRVDGFEYIGFGL